MNATKRRWTPSNDARHPSNHDTPALILWAIAWQHDRRESPPEAAPSMISTRHLQQATPRICRGSFCQGCSPSVSGKQPQYALAPGRPPILIALEQPERETGRRGGAADSGAHWPWPARYREPSRHRAPSANPSPPDICLLADVASRLCEYSSGAYDPAHTRANPVNLHHPSSLQEIALRMSNAKQSLHSPMRPPSHDPGFATGIIFVHDRSSSARHISRRNRMSTHTIMYVLQIGGVPPLSPELAPSTDLPLISRTFAEGIMRSATPRELACDSADTIWRSSFHP
jgi:hypothetical protein